MTVNLDDRYVVTDAMKQNVDNPFLKLDDIDTFYFVWDPSYADTTNDYAQLALRLIYGISAPEPDGGLDPSVISEWYEAKAAYLNGTDTSRIIKFITDNDLPFSNIYEAIVAIDEMANITLSAQSNLLDLALKYNPIDLSKGEHYRLASITKKVDSNGNVTYEAVQGARLPADTSKTVASMENAAGHLPIAYYALAVCYEKALIQQDLMELQVKIIEEWNGKIRTNNEYLRILNKIYSELYNDCIANYKNNDYVLPNDATTDFHNYLQNLKSDIDKVYPCGNYDKEGKNDSLKGYENIDVVEQGHLTRISNAQEAIRMHGDELSTYSQEATTKLTKITQDLNSFISIASSVCKGAGDCYKNMASNIR